MIKNKHYKSLNFKLLSLIFMAITPLILGLFFYVFPVFESYLIEQRKAEVKTGVDIIIGMIDKIHKDAEAGKWDKKKEAEEIQKLFVGVRYNKTDYFFAYDSRGYGAVHPIKPEYIGTDRSQSKDGDGRMYVKDFLTYVGKEEGGFVPYKFEKVKGEKPVDKVSFVKYYAPLDWIVGSGV